MRRGLLLAAAGLVMVVAAGVTSLLDPSRHQFEPDPSIWPSLLAGLGALALLAGAWLERDGLRRAAAARQARFGAFALVYTLVVLIALAALAFLVERRAWRFDLTQDNSASLEADTLRVLRSIPADGEPVEVFGVVGGGGLTGFDSAAAFGKLQPLFKLLDQSGARVVTQAVDAAREPALAQALGIARVPSVAVRWTPPGEEAARVARTDILEEREIARTIEQVLLGTTRPAYVLQGHGESSAIDTDSAGGLFRTMMAVASDNYDVRPLNLVEKGVVPEDAELLVIAGPQTDFVSAEIELLQAYLRRGGRFLLLLGPAFDRDGQVRSLPLLEDWLARDLGIALGRSLVCDIDGLSGPGADLRWLVVPPQPGAPHPILRGRDRTLMLPLVRPVLLAREMPHGARGEMLLRSGQRSWAEAETPTNPVYGTSDERGPHGLALAATFKPWDQEREARVFLIGCHLFAGNDQITLAGNGSFLLDAVAWLGDRKEVLEARAERARDGTAVIPETQGFLILACAAAIPFVLLAFGVVTWWHRRRL